MKRSCERSSDVLPNNISYPEFIELRIQKKKLHSSDLNTDFGRKFGLSSSNMKELKENLHHMEIKGEHSVTYFINTFVAITHLFGGLNSSGLLNLLWRN